MTIVLTGATGGIGRAILASLARRTGCTVILACRSEAKASQAIAALDGCAASLHFVGLDLMSLDSVRTAADAIARRWPQIDALVNNAGAMPARLNISPDGYEAATQTNFVATRLLTLLLLRKAEVRKVVFTTSLTRHLVRLRRDWAARAVSHQGRFTTYGRSKLMITCWAARLSQRPEARATAIMLADPGAAATEMTIMGCKTVDRLADWLARPLMSTPAQGAAPALAAIDCSVPAGSPPLLFSRRPGHTAVSRLPRRYFKDVPCLPEIGE